MDKKKKRSTGQGRLEQFHDYLVKEERASATITKYLHDVNIFYEYAAARGNEPEAEHVTKELVIEFKNWLLQQYHVRSVNSMLAALNSFLRFAGRNECRVKLVKVQKQMICEEKKELKKQEYYRLVKAARDSGNERLAMILQTLCGLGLRISELKFVTVEAVKKGKLQVLNKGKNRAAFISGKLQKQLLLYIGRHKLKTGEVFITKNGKQMDRSNIWREMKKLSEQAEVEQQKIFPHNLRHLFARTFYELKKDVVKLADIMGHSNIETTRIYTSTSGVEYRRQLEALGLIL